jgi:hypothetical protein
MYWGFENLKIYTSEGTCEFKRLELFVRENKRQRQREEKKKHDINVSTAV